MALQSARCRKQTQQSWHPKILFTKSVYSLLLFTATVSIIIVIVILLLTVIIVTKYYVGKVTP